jgi:molybdate transport system substrate-binding protein
MKLKLLFIIIIISNLSIAKNINIAVSANVSYAIDELKREFNSLYPDIKVDVTLGSSGKLTAQIKNSAPYQLFMSANMKYPNALYNSKIAITEPVVYAQGVLAYLSNKKRDFNRTIEEILTDKEIEKIAIANPKTAPYGKASFEALKSAKILNRIKSKFIYGQSISQTVTYSVMVADIGLIAKSSLYSPKMSRYKEGINWSDIDRNLYRPIEQGIVILKNGKDNLDVKAFYDFIVSDRAKKIFSRFGYITP